LISTFGHAIPLVLIYMTQQKLESVVEINVKIENSKLEIREVPRNAQKTCLGCILGKRTFRLGQYFSFFKMLDGRAPRGDHHGSPFPNRVLCVDTSKHIYQRRTLTVTHFSLIRHS